MDGSTQRCRSVIGEQSVCESDPCFPASNLRGYSAGFYGTHNFVFHLLDKMRRNSSAGALTCDWTPVVYLKHVGCILHIVTFPKVLGTSSSYRVPTAACLSMAVVFDV